MRVCECVQRGVYKPLFAGLRFSIKCKCRAYRRHTIRWNEETRRSANDAYAFVLCAQLDYGAHGAGFGVKCAQGAGVHLSSKTGPERRTTVAQREVNGVRVY